MLVELFQSPGCRQCALAQASLKAVALAVEGMEWRELNVLDELDYAVAGGLTLIVSGLYLLNTQFFLLGTGPGGVNRVRLFRLATEH